MPERKALKGSPVNGDFFDDMPYGRRDMESLTDFVICLLRKRDMRVASERNVEGAVPDGNGANFCQMVWRA